MSRLRLSSHKLLIERGIWLKIAHNVRLCDECNVLEDEYHVICICKRYTQLSDKYIITYYIKKPSMFKYVQHISCVYKTDIYIARAIHICLVYICD